MIAKTEPYYLGYMSFYSGVPKINNPYPSDSGEYEEWNRGWEEAREEAENSE